MWGLPENYPFESFRPRGWNPFSDSCEPVSLKLPKDMPEEEKKEIYRARMAELKKRLLEPPEPPEPEAYSLAKSHGVCGNIVIRNENDDINIGRAHRDQVVLEYVVEGPGAPKSYPMVTNRCIELAAHRFYEEKNVEKPDLNVRGRLIAEAEARSTLEHWLTNYRPDGRVLPLIPPHKDPAECEDWLVANNDQYILKIKNYPNLLLLERNAQAAFGDIKGNYKSLAEIDGFFHYQLGNQRITVVMESKSGGGFDTNADELLYNLFMPLSRIDPQSRFAYALFLPPELMFEDEELRILRPRPLKVYKTLREAGVSTLLFTLSRSRDQYGEFERQVMNQYKLNKGEQATYHGRLVRHNENYTFYNGSPKPLVGFVPAGTGDLYRRIPARPAPEPTTASFDYCI